VAVAQQQLGLHARQGGVAQVALGRGEVTVARIAFGADFGFGIKGAGRDAEAVERRRRFGLRARAGEAGQQEGALQHAGTGTGTNTDNREARHGCSETMGSRSIWAPSGWFFTSGCRQSDPFTHRAAHGCKGL